MICTEALQRWVASRLLDYYVQYNSSVFNGTRYVACGVDRSTLTIDLSSVNITTEFDLGYSCCGGSNPDCYCEMAQSPSASVVLSGLVVISHTDADDETYQTTEGIRMTLDLDSFSFEDMLVGIAQIVASDGLLEIPPPPAKARKPPKPKCGSGLRIFDETIEPTF